MPGSFMSVLAVSEQGEQAVVTTTLVLWRSMGQVLGVAVSSLIVQNSLVGFLNVNVVGPDKEKVFFIRILFFFFFLISSLGSTRLYCS